MAPARPWLKRTSGGAGALRTLENVRRASHRGRHRRSAAALQNTVLSWIQLGYLDLPLREPYNSRVLGANEASAVEARGLIHVQSVHLIIDKRPTMMGEGYLL